MKTTKKGFTLIELIVVIAIIGVLAAILVPSMLGYVKKSKIQSANSAASSYYKAINSALIELDEAGLSITDGTHSLGTGGVGAAEDDDYGTLNNLAGNYFDDVAKVQDGAIAVVGGTCKALVMTTNVNATYIGSYPAIINADNYSEGLGWDATNNKITTGETPAHGTSAKMEDILGLAYQAATNGETIPTKSE